MERNYAQMTVHSAQKDGQGANSHLSHIRKSFRPHGDYLKCRCSHRKEKRVNLCGTTVRHRHFINTIPSNP